MKTIDVTTLQQALAQQSSAQEKKIFLLDVREENEYLLCHVDGATLIPLGQIPQRLDEIPKDAEIVAYCHHGRRSEMALRFLQANGYDNIVNMQGGIDAWAVLVDPTMTRY